MSDGSVRRQPETGRGSELFWRLLLDAIAKSELGPTVAEWAALIRNNTAAISIPTHSDAKGTGRLQSRALQS